MKIGILTFHNACNYGAVLQAYALQTFLTKNGFDTNIVDYRPKYIEDAYKLMPIKHKDNKRTIPKSYLKTGVYNILNIKSYQKKRYKFMKFMNEELNLTKDTYSSSKELSKVNLDACIFGSDQIWNPNITNGIDGAYFGEFLNKNIIKIAYAASTGLREIPEEYENRFKDLIFKLDSISIREHQMIERLSEYAKREVAHVLDPTFLLEQDDYEDISIDLKIKEKYLLIYNLNLTKKEERIYEAAYTIADKLGIKIIEIGKSTNSSKIYRKHRCLLDVGPKEFVGLFKQADYVITNSFHGTALSIIFNKQFYTFSNHPVSDRMTSLLMTLDIGDRFLDEHKDLKKIEKINYYKVNKRLSEKTRESIDFLLQSLNVEDREERIS